MFWTRSMPGALNTTLSRQLNLFNRFFNNTSGNTGNRSVPACNLWVGEEEAVLTSEVPGFAMENIEITITGRDIVIKGVRQEKHEEGAKLLRQERNQGEFERAFQLPFQIDAGKVEAKLVNGVLEVALPRTENDKPRKITVIGG